MADFSFGFTEGSFLLLNDQKHLHCIAKIHAHWVQIKLSESITLDIITRLLDNASFVCVHVGEDFLKISRKCVG